MSFLNRVTERVEAAGFAPGTELLPGVDVQMLIDTVFHNEKVRDEKAVLKVWKELVKHALDDGMDKAELDSAKAKGEAYIKQWMKDIIKEAQDPDL